MYKLAVSVTQLANCILLCMLIHIQLQLPAGQTQANIAVITVFLI